MPLAIDYVIANGIADEDEYPYTAYQSSCEYEKEDSIGKPASETTIPVYGNVTWMKYKSNRL